jgi:hypothetical protein
MIGAEGDALRDREIFRGLEGPDRLEVAIKIVVHFGPVYQPETGSLGWLEQDTERGADLPVIAIDLGLSLRWPDWNNQLLLEICILKVNPDTHRELIVDPEAQRWLYIDGDQLQLRPKRAADPVGLVLEWQTVGCREACPESDSFVDGNRQVERPCEKCITGITAVRACRRGARIRIKLHAQIKHLCTGK